MIIIWVEWSLSRVFGIHLQIHQKILAWVSPPPPFWQCQDFQGVCSGIPSLTSVNHKHISTYVKWALSVLLGFLLGWPILINQSIFRLWMPMQCNIMTNYKWPTSINLKKKSISKKVFTKSVLFSVTRRSRSDRSHSLTHSLTEWVSHG